MSSVGLVHLNLKYVTILDFMYYYQRRNRRKKREIKREREGEKGMKEK
jgi:hypothetical protein